MLSLSNCIVGALFDAVFTPSIVCWSCCWLNIRFFSLIGSGGGNDDELATAVFDGVIAMVAFANDSCNGLITFGQTKFTCVRRLRSKYFIYIFSFYFYTFFVCFDVLCECLSVCARASGFVFFVFFFSHFAVWFCSFSLGFFACIFINMLLIVSSVWQWLFFVASYCCFRYVFLLLLFNSWSGMNTNVNSLLIAHTSTEGENEKERERRATETIYKVFWPSDYDVNNIVHAYKHQINNKSLAYSVHFIRCWEAKDNTSMTETNFFLLSYYERRLFCFSFDNLFSVFQT